MYGFDLHFIRAIGLFFGIKEHFLLDFHISIAYNDKYAKYFLYLWLKALLLSCNQNKTT